MVPFFLFLKWKIEFVANERVSEGTNEKMPKHAQTFTKGFLIHLTSISIHNKIYINGALPKLYLCLCASVDVCVYVGGYHHMTGSVSKFLCRAHISNINQLGFVYILLKTIQPLYLCADYFSKGALHFSCSWDFMCGVCVFMPHFTGFGDRVQSLKNRRCRKLKPLQKPFSVCTIDSLENGRKVLLRDEEKGSIQSIF